MIPYERRKQLLLELEQKEVVSLDDFCAVLPGVSQSTIRRDLKTLEDEGQVVLLRGGAAKMKTGSYDTPVNSRKLLNVQEKERIARCAAELVQDGEVIYVDSGSTAMRMLRHLKDKRITVVSTSATLFQEICETALQCILVGGELNIPTASIAGPLTDTTLQSMFFDRAFIGASGFDWEAGINTPDWREANKKKIVLGHSKKVYVLADHSKSGKVTMCKAFDLRDATVICDQETPILTKSGNFIIAK